MKKLNIGGFIQNTLDREKLVGRCREIMETIEDLAPSDNNVLLSIEQQGQKFVANIGVVSRDLTFNLQSAASSAFMAVETAMKEALFKVNKWSAMRKLTP